MKTLSFFFLFATSMNCFAQNVEPKNELGLNLYGFEIDIDYFGDGLYQNYYANGLQYKRKLGLNYKLRLSGQYFTRAENGTWDFSSSPDGGVYSWSYITSTYEVRSGLERSFFATPKIVPFFFADLVYRQTNDKGVSRGSSWLGRTESQIDQNAYSAGGILGLGIKYNPLPSVYIGVETSIGKYWDVFSGQQNGYRETYFCPIKTLMFGVNF